jgi:hypothetical protein
MDAYTVARYTIADLYFDEDGEPLFQDGDRVLDEAVGLAVDACVAQGLNRDESERWAYQAAELLLLGDSYR